MNKIELSDIKHKYKKINGFEDYYITEDGDVYSVRLRGYEKEPHLHKLKPKNPGNNSKYLNVILCKDGQQQTKAIHRLVAEHFCDGYFEGAVVNHKDGNNRNNAYWNLEWTTQKENVHHSYKNSNRDQVRNFKWWVLVNPYGKQKGVFKGHEEMERYVKANIPYISASMLVKHGYHKGYKIIKRDKSEAVTTTVRVHDR